MDAALMRELSNRCFVDQMPLNRGVNFQLRSWAGGASWLARSSYAGVAPHPTPTVGVLLLASLFLLLTHTTHRKHQWSDPVLETPQRGLIEADYSEGLRAPQCRKVDYFSGADWGEENNKRAQSADSGLEPTQSTQEHRIRIH